MRAATARPFGVNLVLHWDQAERLQICLDGGVPVISLFWGDPSAHVAACHSAGARLLHTVATASEARRVVDLGVDCVVAQGSEAGGHVWGEVSTFPLVPAVVDAVSPVPVVAAGGIADGRGLVAALALGAAGAWLGTRFVASSEARAHPGWQQGIVGASERLDAPDHAVRPRLGGRSRARAADASRRAGRRQAARTASAMPTPRRCAAIRAPSFARCYAGQSAALVHDVAPAGELVRRIAREAEATLQALA